MERQNRNNQRIKQDKVNDQPDGQPADNLPSNRLVALTQSRALKWIVSVLIFMAIFLHYRQLPLPKQMPVSQHDQMQGVKPVKHNCQSMPPHGTVYAIDPSVMQRTDVLYSGLQIINQHDHAMVAVLSDKFTARQYLAVSILPGKSIQISVPVGAYGMEVYVGSKWCNLHTGFTDGAKIVVDGGVSLQVGLTTALEFHGLGINPVQLALAYSAYRPTNRGDSRKPTEIIGAGELELVQANNGHYFSSGTINDTPVVFLIDTGATNVSISSVLATRVVIRNCQPHQVMTANGSVNACMAIVPEITFGAFQLTNVEVTVMPNMSDEALLGMNVLRNFRIEQIDDVMRISLR